MMKRSIITETIAHHLIDQRVQKLSESIEDHQLEDYNLSAHFVTPSKTIDFSTNSAIAPSDNDKL